MEADPQWVRLAGSSSSVGGGGSGSTPPAVRSSGLAFDARGRGIRGGVRGRGRLEGGGHIGVATRIGGPVLCAGAALVRRRQGCLAGIDALSRRAPAKSAAARRGTRTVASCRVHIDVVKDEPLIWVVDGLCTRERSEQLRALLAKQDMDSFKKTDAYIDDMFDEGRAAEEDAQLLVSMLRTGSFQFVPEEYRGDPLRAFLWVASSRGASVSDADLHRGLQAVARRAWCSRWDPADLQRSGFRKSAGRWQVPEPVLRRLAPLVAALLGAPVAGLPGSDEVPYAPGRKISWALRDTTVVRYREGESQVPHVDTSDVTILLYLSDAGGRTCFPNLNCSVQPADGRVLLFSSTKPQPTRFGGFAGSAYGEPNDATMHYGGLMEAPQPAGEKLIVQLLFAAVDESIQIPSWREALLGEAVQKASYSSGMEIRQLSLPPPADLGRQAPWTLALSGQRCASGCADRALDLRVGDGSPLLCIYCWQKRLEGAGRQ